MPEIFTFEDKRFVPDIVHSYDSSLRNESTALIIDNGSHSCRVGWACDESPRLVFRNLIAKPKGRKELEAGGSQIGNDITNLDNVKWNIKTQFDNDIVTHFDAQEQVFDYIFTNLGLCDESSISHPILMTEAVCNPNCCRQKMSELLFECYNVPSVLYGVDSLFSLKKNIPSADDALIISIGYNTIHVLPVLNGKMVPQHCRRINIGGSNAMALMHRVLQLKYPQHSNDITLSRAQELVETHTYLAYDYSDELNKWKLNDFIDQNERILQLPYKDIMTNSARDQEKDRERKIRQGRRLQELNAKRKAEKLAKDVTRLQMLTEVLNKLLADRRTIKSQLKKVNLETVDELQDEINELTSSVNQRTIKPTETSQLSQEVSVKDDNEDSQNSASFETMTEVELEEWLASLRNERNEILETRRKRQQRRQELGVRKSHAFKERMRILSKLAHDGKSSKTQKKPKEDTFGMNDEDWEVYKYISRDESDSDGEQERLVEIENILSQNDSQFLYGSKLTSESSESDWAAYYQLRISTERIRIPEIIYQPSLLGMEQAGLTETIDFVLKKFTEEEQQRLVKNVFVTGGGSSFPGFTDRLKRELLAIRPFQSHFDVSMASNPILDAWYGARDFARRSSHLTEASITRQNYDEQGFEYLKEHSASNLYFPTPT